MKRERANKDEIASWLRLCWYVVRLNKCNRLIQSEHIETGIEIVEKKNITKK